MVNRQHTATCINSVLEAFPESISEDVIEALDALDGSSHEPHIHDGLHRVVDNHTLVLPSRVYFSGVREHKIKSLSSQQRQIVAALMTRHHSGYRRESWGRELCRSPSMWATPFVVDLLGDYVLEILVMLESNLDRRWEPFAGHFLAENKGITTALNHRILNYWHCYYRWYHPNIRELRDYPGYVVAERLGLWERGIGKRLLRKKC